MKKSNIFLVASLFFFLPLIHGVPVNDNESKNRSEVWGYVEVRPKAHMFWWLYKSPYRVPDSEKEWPVVLWLQGGPGSSGVGIGNFEEFGPLDVDLALRKSTWLKKADLLFVDNPVGTGYSYVEEDSNLFVKTDEEATTDLTTLLMEIFNKDPSLQKSPVYIMAESYGGKYAVMFALSACKAIKSGNLNLKLGGVVLGNSWISPEDYAFSLVAMLRGILDPNGLQKSDSLTQKIKQQIENGEFEAARNSWDELTSTISASSNNVNFYNFKRASGSGCIPGGRCLHTLMNGRIRKKLEIIPDNVVWKENSDPVFESLAADFMKPRIKEVDELLGMGVDVTIYNGNYDLLCSTKGTEAWVKKLKWDGLQNFLSLNKTPVYCGDDREIKGYTKSYTNFHFYWILRSGHYVPIDQPCLALAMVGTITHSPSISH